MHCADCGTRYRKGFCPNCHEEAYILAYQTDTYDGAFSAAFLECAEQQCRDAEKALRAAKAAPEKETE